VLVREEAVVRVPASADPALVAPHLCAGVTVFNGIRKLHIEQGALVAVQGLGGLGHLAVQFAHKMGYKVVAISSGSDKAQFAEQLGAYAYIDTSKDDAAKILQSMGGASLIVSTAPNAQAISPLVWGLTYGGKLLLLAPIGPVAVDSVALVMKAASVHGWPGGNALDCEETIAFAEHHGVQCMVERFPLNEAVKAFNHMVQGKPKFRAVLTM
jgi:D-arabinose 1-dehydrogenase-like Zn-dependent alcohol dehydrogenase